MADRRNGMGHLPGIACGLAGLALLLASLSPARAEAEQPATSYAEAVAAYDGGDFLTARERWSQLAACGDADAQVALGGLYLSGRGVPAPDPARAVDLYRAAAEQGHAVAQLNLGDFYSRGVGVERDPVQAYRWLTLAARQGRGWAERQRQEIAGQLTAAQLERARRLLAD